MRAVKRQGASQGLRHTAPARWAVSAKRHNAKRFTLGRQDAREELSAAQAAVAEAQAAAAAPFEPAAGAAAPPAEEIEAAAVAAAAAARAAEDQACILHT